MTPSRVLHLVDTFGARSETFIYAYVTSHVAFDASVVCRRREHEHEFPFPRVQVVPEAQSRAHPERWLSTALGYATGRTLWHRRLERAIAVHTPDVIHAHFGQFAAHVLPVVQRLGVPLVTSFYGYDASAFASSTAGRRALQPLLGASRLFFAEGPVMRQRLTEIGIAADRIRLIRIGMDLAKYPPWQPDRDAPAMLFVGRLVEKKGLVDALRAFARVHAARPQLRLRRIAGSASRMRR